jgi:hypothetical protein
MTRDLITTWTAILTLTVSLLAAARVTRAIDAQRQQLELVVSMEGTQGMPAHVALATAALGTFRGLAVDFLWARADHLQTEGLYFEAQTLSQWITALQPRFPRVWSFQAWNLAYNISAATLFPEERWSWVSRGIDLLRNRGIPLNPTSADLYGELSLLFHQKIGGRLDREHFYYKARFAEEMMEVVGDMTTGRSTADAIERFRKVADAPDTVEALRTKDPLVSEILRLVESHGEQLDERLLRMVGRIVLQGNSVDSNILGDQKRLPQGTNAGLMQAVRATPERLQIFFDHVVPFLQKRVLLGRYHMDARRMLDLMELYGPLDWRHPNTHGLYWGEEGVRVARDVLRRDQINELTIVRSRLHTLLNLVQTGRIDYDPVTKRIDVVADPRFCAAYELSLENAFALIDSEKGVSAAEFAAAEKGDLFQGYARFLEIAVLANFLYGDQEEATAYFTTLREITAQLEQARTSVLYRDSLAAAVNDTVETFVALRVAKALNVDIANTRQFIDAMVRRGLVDGLAKGDLDVFGRFMVLARKAHDRQFEGDLPGGVPANKMVELAPFPTLVDLSFKSLMRQETMPLIDRARIWAWTPDDIKKRTWPDLRTTLIAQAKSAQLDPDRAFPAPSGDPGDIPADASDGGQTEQERRPARPQDSGVPKESSARRSSLPAVVLAGSCQGRSRAMPPFSASHVCLIWPRA